MVMYKIDRGVQKSYTRTDPFMTDRGSISIYLGLG